MVLFSPMIEGACELQFASNPLPFASAGLDASLAETRARLVKFSPDDRTLMKSLTLWLVDGAPDFETDKPQVDLSAVPIHCSRLGALHACQQQLGEPPDIGNAIRPGWADLHVTLAFDSFLQAYISAYMGTPIPDDAVNPWSRQLKATAKEYLSEACEAIAFAAPENLRIPPPVRPRVLFATMEQLAQHQRTRELKDAVLGLYETRYAHLSSWVAAKEVISEFDAFEDLGAISLLGDRMYRIRFYGRDAILRSNPGKKFEDWIEEYKNAAGRWRA